MTAAPPRKAVPEVVVVIVAFNSGPYLQQTLDALQAQSFTDFETIVWDNASSDGSVDCLRLPDARFAVRAMGSNRIELSGFTDAMRDRLRAYGLFHEIISWKLRMFVPTDAGGVTALTKVLARYPVQRIGEREAA